MKLIILCKRRPMGRDLVQRPYGRFSNLARVLASRGHEVHLALLSYQLDVPVNEIQNGYQVYSIPALPTAITAYLRLVKKLIREKSPDWLIGVSDTYYGILAQRYGARYGIRSLIDAYDNFESYISWCTPLHVVWRRALRNATAISAAGPALLEFMSEGRGPKPRLLMPMAADRSVFQRLDKQDCRAEFGLPHKAKLVGYCGSIYPNRGIDVLFQAMEILGKSNPDVQLVLSGRVHPRLALPANCIWLGYLADDKVPRLINSLDVLAVVNQPSAFGSFSYPVKLYEAMSCGIPAVATRTQATEWILESRAELLAAPGDAKDLSNKLARALTIGSIDYGRQTTWEDSGTALEKFLLSINAQV
jgi:glycosyltransferase involved in cell wall biosynthesis